MNAMTEIRFIASGANSVLGGFSSGDVVRVAPAFARHLVEEARVAEYVTAPAEVAPAPTRTTKARPRKEKSE